MHILIYGKFSLQFHIVFGFIANDLFLVNSIYFGLFFQQFPILRHCYDIAGLWRNTVYGHVFIKMAEKIVSVERDREKPRSVPSSREDSVDKPPVSGILNKRATSERSSASPSKGKAPARKELKTVESEILSAVKGIQSAMQKQDEKMSQVMTRLGDIENYTYDGNEYEYDEVDPEEGCSFYEEEPSGVSQSSTDLSTNLAGQKRKESEANPRFATMAKRFKTQERCDVAIDETLAQNVTELFRNGIDDDRYAEMIKDETNGRPENCDGLVTVKTNQLVWDAVTPAARTNDLKFQKIETSVIKAATILSKVVNKMAAIENEHDKFGEMIDDCNSSLALLGHSNKQICMVRRDLFKPELKDEYAHLCTHSLPYTSWLFGDDVSKKTKEIEDSNKLGYKIHKSGFRGSFRGRGNFRGRYRGRGRGTGTRGKPYYQSSYTASNNDTKNVSKKGTGKPTKA